MAKWIAKVARYKRQIKIGIPRDLSRLAGLNRCEFVEMGIDKRGKIIMEAIYDRENEKLKG